MRKTTCKAILILLPLLTACGVKTASEVQSSAKYATKTVSMDGDFEDAYRRLASTYAKYFEFDGTVYSDMAVATFGNPSLGYIWIVELVPDENRTEATISVLPARGNPAEIIEVLRP